MKVKFYILSFCWILMALPVLVSGQGVIIPSGIYLRMSEGTLVLHGDWMNNGSYADTNGTIILNDTAQQVIGGDSSSQFSNMTINNPAGIRGSNNFVVKGVLHLESANASAFLGTLDMDTNTLTMGGSATTIGPGDVTGIVRRTTLIANTVYTLGNQFTTIDFQDLGTLPSEISMKITLGTAPDWKTDGIKRITAIIRTGGSGSFATLSVHYLDTELNGNTENNLVAWVCITPFTPGTGFEFGRSNYNTTENWVESTGFDISYLPTSFDIQNSTLGVSLLTNSTWNGSESTVWTTPGNWTPYGVPSDNTTVGIPDAATTPNDPTTSPTLFIGRLELSGNAILNAPATSTLTISGATGAWINNGGTFNASTGNVIFVNANPTIAGTTNFYDVTIPDTVVLWLTSTSIMRIAGAITNDGTWRTVIGGPTTVEYNGGNQTVVVPNPATNRYSTLILSGSGTKTMPSTALAVYGDFSMSGTATATAGARIRTVGNFTIGSGAAFTTGAFNDSIGGNFSNSGTFTSTGSTITCNGTTAQTIGGTSATTFNNLISANAAGVTLISDELTTVTGTLTVNSGKKFNVSAGKQLTTTGTITNNGGTSGFVIHSDATGTASLLHNTNNVPATVERYISGDAEAWHFLSSPVAAQGITGSWLPSGTYGNGTGYDMYLWNEPTNCWIYKNDSTSTINWKTIHAGADFVVGRGYLYSVQAANPTKAFAGNLNNGSISYGLTTSSFVDSLKGFNLVGNPYPSSIDWRASSGWTRSGLVSTGGGYNMWIWNPAANNYGVYNSADADGVGTNSVTRHIAPAQGYFVLASGAGNLEMNNDVRVHDDAGNWFKSIDRHAGTVSLNVISEDGYGSDEIQLGFGYDKNENVAMKLFSKAISAPSLFMPSLNEYCSVRYLTDTIENPRVPVMFKPGRDGNFTLKCDFDPNEFEMVMLEDLQRHYIQNMRTIDTYGFHSSTSDDPSRFILHFGPDNKATYAELPARIYTDGTQLIIDLTLVGKETEAYVCDILGRTLLQKTLQGLSQHKLSINARSQILMVYLKNQQGNISRKLYYN